MFQTQSHSVKETPTKFELNITYNNSEGFLFTNKYLNKLQIVTQVSIMQFYVLLSSASTNNKSFSRRKKRIVLQYVNLSGLYRQALGSCSGRQFSLFLYYRMTFIHNNLVGLIVGVLSGKVLLYFVNGVGQFAAFVVFWIFLKNQPF